MRKVGPYCQGPPLEISQKPVTVASNPTIEATDATVMRGSLRKELGLRDLVLAQLLIIIVPDYIGTAVKAGPWHVIFWLVAIGTFFLPLAAVVIHLSRLLPMEGGLYEWARLAFGNGMGFLVAWNLWLFTILYIGLGGLVALRFASYLIPDIAWIADSKWMIVAGLLAIVIPAMTIAGVGLNVGKWINNVGAVALLLTLAVLTVTPFLNVWRGTLSGYHPLRLVVPPLNLFSLSVFSKMTFGALTGFEYVAAFADECHAPKKHLPRSVWLSGPIVALVYILSTSAILAFVRPGSEDVVAPIPQALSLGLHAFGLREVVFAPAVLFILINYFATFCAFFTGSTRLPMVAGWDHLLPEWFSRLHPRYKTPINSILLLGAATLFVCLIALIGVRPDESYELLLTWSFTFYAIAYLALFAIPIFSRRERGLRAGLWVRCAAGSGLVVTALFVALSIFPIIDVVSSWRYSLKIAGVVVGANLLGWLIFRAERTTAGELA